MSPTCRLATARLRLAPLLLLLLLAGCKTQLNTGLSEMAANEVVALLLRSDIPAGRAQDAKSGLYTVLVEQGRFADAVDLLRAHGLPKPHYDSIPDMFKGGGLVASPTEEHARILYAQGEELSHTISEIDGVLTARVHIVEQDSDPLRRDAPPASASVFVRYKEGSRVADLVPQIKMLVADGVSGLAYEKVSVVMVPAALPDAGIAAASEMQNVFGLWIYGGSAAFVRFMIACLAGLGAGVLAVAGLAGWRLRHRVIAFGREKQHLLLR